MYKIVQKVRCGYRLSAAFNIVRDNMGAKFSDCGKLKRFGGWTEALHHRSNIKIVFYMGNAGNIICQTEEPITVTNYKPITISK